MNSILQIKTNTDSFPKKSAYYLPVAYPGRLQCKLSTAASVHAEVTGESSRPPLQKCQCPFGMDYAMSLIISSLITVVLLLSRSLGSLIRSSRSTVQKQELKKLCRTALLPLQISFSPSVVIMESTRLD